MYAREAQRRSNANYVTLWVEDEIPPFVALWQRDQLEAATRDGASCYLVIATSDEPVI